MQRSSIWFAITIAGALASGCDCAGALRSNDNPCERPNRPAACGQLCSATEPCPAGFYCAASGTCTADCLPGDPSASCPAPAVCSADGTCVYVDGGNASRDASWRYDASGCANVTVATRRVTPNVILIVDQSSSMTSRFGGSDRWRALRDSLMAQPDGLVYALQSQVRFGLALYSANAPDDDEVIGTCPMITWVPPALNNHSAIDEVYRAANPIDETPTGESIDEVARLFAMAPDPTDDPTIFILATDGEPDTCAQPNPQNGQAYSVAATERAYAMGIRTFVISVGSGTVSAAHLQDIANAGLGRGPSDPDAEYWVAGDDAGLRDALLSIIGGELSCVVELNGRIQNLDKACSGIVELGGTRLTCNDPNGWRVVDDRHIELLGDACDTFQSGADILLEAKFPCDVILF